MKYNDPILETANEAHNIILSKIVPGSTVLEFGAANGRMTKKLKEELGCSVYIVEIEKEAYDEAILYADEGICDDISTLSWKKWAGVDFDYILFADVLEHLVNPYLILNEVHDFIKDSGCILLSVPNIAHNDIWAKLYLGCFEYTNIGILDNTHLHFWAENSLSDFELGGKFHIVSVDYKTIPTLTTEQFLNNRIDIPESIMEFLYTRTNGEVYQFVLELRKANFCRENVTEKTSDIYPGMVTTVYFDRGHGFSQGDCTVIVAERSELGEIIVDTVLTVEEDVKRLRIDPIEGMPCLIKEIAVDGCVVVGCNKEELMTGQGLVLYSADPQLVCEVRNRTICIKLRYSVGYSKICDAIFSWGKRNEHIEELSEQMNNAIAGIENQYKNMLDVVLGEFEKNRNQLAAWEKQNEALAEKCTAMHMEKERVEKEYAVSLVEKERIEKEYAALLVEKERIDILNSDYVNKISQLEQENLNAAKCNSELKETIERYESSRWWERLVFFKNK